MYFVSSCCITYSKNLVRPSIDLLDIEREEVCRHSLPRLFFLLQGEGTWSRAEIVSESLGVISFDCTHCFVCWLCCTSFIRELWILWGNIYTWDGRSLNEYFAFFAEKYEPFLESWILCRASQSRYARSADVRRRRKNSIESEPQQHNWYRYSCARILQQTNEIRMIHLIRAGTQ